MRGCRMPTCCRAYCGGYCTVQMNLADSERMAGTLESAGYTCAEDVSDADVIVYNTCSIRDKVKACSFGLCYPAHILPRCSGQLPLQCQDIVIYINKHMSVLHGLVVLCLRRDLSPAGVLLGNATNQHTGDLPM